MADLIQQQLDQLENPDEAHIFFSAHGVPLSYVEEAGDPYQQEIEECTELIMQRLNRSNPYTLAYQSRVGPVEWLKPYTEEAILELAEQGVKTLVVVPVLYTYLDAWGRRISAWFTRKAPAQAPGVATKRAASQADAD